MNQPAKIFTSFASKDYASALRRISNEAHSVGFFDAILTMSEDDLSRQFTSRFSTKLKHGTRGFGFWCWKPEVLRMAFQQARDGDVVLYCDAGCQISGAGKDRLNEYFDLAVKSKSGIVAFQSGLAPPKNYVLEQSPPVWLERVYTKGDVFDYFSVRDRAEIVESGQFISGIFLLRKCPSTEDLINKWAKVYELEFSLVTDDPSKSANLKGFLENKHDQSVFSILCKLAGAESISNLEVEPQLGSGLTWDDLVGQPILAKRNKRRHFLYKIYKLKTVVTGLLMTWFVPGTARKV